MFHDLHDSFVYANIKVLNAIKTTEELPDI